MAWVDGLHIGSVVGPEAKQKDTRYPYPYLVPCCALQWALSTRQGRTGQGRAGQGGRYVPPSPCPPCTPAPWPRPCTPHVSIWCGRAARGGPGQARAAQVARSLDFWRGTRGEGWKPSTGLSRGSFARTEGALPWATTPGLFSLPGPPTPKSEFRAQGPPTHSLAHFLGPSGLSPTVCGPPSGGLTDSNHTPTRPPPPRPKKVAVPKAVGPGLACPVGCGRT